METLEKTWSFVLGTWTKLLAHAQKNHFRTASHFVNEAIRNNRSLHSSERRWAAETLFHLIRMLRRNQALAGLKHPSAAALFWTSRFDEWAAHPKTAELTQNIRSALIQHGLDEATLQKRWTHWQTEFDNIKTLPDPALRLGEWFSYPTWIVTLLLTQHGLDTTINILHTQNHRAPLTLRVNLCKTSRTELISAFSHAGISCKTTFFSDSGIVLDTHHNVHGLPWFEQGHFEVQDEGSQLIAELVDPPEGGTVIDACAGAGGKTLAIGSLMKNRGRIWALDVHADKLAELQKRTRRAGLTNTTSKRWTDSTYTLPLADRVLCDVPCSGLGVLRRHPEARWSLQASELPTLYNTQLGILEKCAPLVKPGGRLIYATCTLLRKENEEVVSAFLRNHTLFEWVPTSTIWGSERAASLGNGQVLQTKPTTPASADGFFAAVLRKKP